MRNLLIIPSVPVPIMVPVMYSPVWLDVIIKAWNTIIIAPTPVIIVRAIPTTLPWPPPPTIPEEQVYLYIGNDVDTIGIGQYDHGRRCFEYDDRRQRYRNSNTDIYLRQRRDREDT
jgi:hypothetical protein